MKSPLSREIALAAVRWASDLPTSTHEAVAERLMASCNGARLQGALARHLRDVSAPEADGRFEATTASVNAALDLLAPGEDKLRTAGAILAGNHFAAAMRTGSSRCPHRLARAAALIRGLWGPRSMAPLDTTAWASAQEIPLSVERLDAQWSGQAEVPPYDGRNYIGAGYDGDGNVDLVFLAHTWGPAWNEGVFEQHRDDVLSGIADWISLRYHEATAGRGPRHIVQLVQQMNAHGATTTLLDDSRVIAGAAWREVLVDTGQSSFQAADIVHFLDGTSFRPHLEVSS